MKLLPYKSAINESSAYVNFYLSDDSIGFFLVHRRVMTVMYKTTGLRGYEIELLLLIIKLTEQDINNQVVGSQIREKCSYRFQRVLGDMLKLLTSQGYITDTRKQNTAKQAWHYVNITHKAIDFFNLWSQTLHTLLKEEKDQLIISISNRNKLDNNKSKIYRNNKK